MKSLRIRLSTPPPSHADARVWALEELVGDEFLEMTDMALTLDQPCTLWSADPGVLWSALDELVDRGVLRLSTGRYVLVS